MDFTFNFELNLEKRKLVFFNPFKIFDTFIDVGVASYGTEDIYNRFPKAKLILIDPLDDAKDYAEKLSKKRNVNFIKTALGKEDGIKKEIKIQKDRGKTSLLEISDINMKDDFTEVKKIEINTLDTVLTSSNVFFEHQEFLDYMVDSEVTHLDIVWDVYTFDGFDGVESSNGPWSLTIDGGWALDVDNNSTIPEVFALHNNYPNPFNPTTNIGYDIPELSKVSIDIYNIAGNKVKTLVSKEHQPGRYKVQWNATNEFGSPVATGMYIYKIRAKDFVSVKKLLLMK